MASDRETAERLVQGADPMHWPAVLVAQITEALAAARAEGRRAGLLEAAVKITLPAADHCGADAGAVWCEQFGCGDLIRLAEGLRALAGKGSP